MKDSWNPLIKYLWRIAYPGTFITKDIEKSDASIEIFCKRYKIFDGTLDKNLIWNNTECNNLKLTADVMTSAGALIKKVMGKTVKELTADCENSEWSVHCMDPYLNRLEKEIKKSFLVFLRLVYTPGNFIVVGKNKSNQKNDQWDYVMMRLDKYKGNIDDIPDKSSLSGRNNKCVLAPFGDSYISDLYLQDYKNEKILKENDWESTFDRYSKLIIKRGIRIWEHNSSTVIEDETINTIIDELKKKYA